jgi:hypothetical protein
MELRDRVAREIAVAFTGCEPDTVVHPECPAAPRVKGGFTAIHQHGAPLYYFFLGAADAAIAEIRACKTDKECHCGRDGHPLHSVNCPVHGREAQIAEAAMAIRLRDSTDEFANARAALDAIDRVRG